MTHNSWEVQERCLPQAVGLASGDSGQEVFDLQNFLRRFGYLRQYGYAPISVYPSNSSLIPTAIPGEFDEGTTTALKTYQEFYGLEPTGVLDEMTVAHMSLPRCGVPDMPYLPRDLEYAHLSFRWRKNDLRWKTGLRFSDGVPSGVTWGQFDDVLRRSFNAWSAVTPLNFSQIGEGDRGADILCRFTTNQPGDNPHDGPGNILALCYNVFDNGTPVAPSQIFFDKSDRWFIPTPNNNAIDLLGVAIHEIGHALGLGHTNVSAAIMFATFGLGQQKRTLDNDDINGIRALYGS
jgi:peptidoglycan hydrolase-like protein with peptidoglycan-binding domain